jgi:phosphatidylglycerol:prolipoprotein diacylglycerol transferase
MKKSILIAIGAIIVSALAFFIFVPAFAGEIQINPALGIGNFEIQWYGLILALGILAAYFFARKNSWKFGISKKALDDYSFWVVLLGILGARVFFVVFNLDYFLEFPQEIYKIWHGGLAIYGGILTGLIFSYFYTRKKAFTFFQLIDLAALSLPLGQAIGRLGNFVNQEAFGLPTSLPWKMYIEPSKRPVEFQQNVFFHPAFLYEIILDLLIFTILYRLIGKTKSGILGLSYLLLYSLGRFFIEAIRLDSLVIGAFRANQLVAFILVVVSGTLILRKYTKN